MNLSFNNQYEYYVEEKGVHIFNDILDNKYIEMNGNRIVFNTALKQFYWNEKFRVIEENNFGTNGGVRKARRINYIFDTKTFEYLGFLEVFLDRGITQCTYLMTFSKDVRELIDMEYIHGSPYDATGINDCLLIEQLYERYFRSYIERRFRNNMLNSSAHYYDGSSPCYVDYGYMEVDDYDDYSSISDSDDTDNDIEMS